MNNGIHKIEKEDYLKIHVAVDIKTNEIIALEGGNRREKVHDSKKLKNLVNHVLDTYHKRKIKSVLADDGAYDSNTNFKYLLEKKITPAIKVRWNSIFFPKNNRLRNRESRLQTKDLSKWKTKRKYGHRDGWLKQSFRLSKECLVSILYLSIHVSKYGKRDDDNSVIV